MSACKWNGRGNPRTITGRHAEDCADDTCRGCQPCEGPHCRLCIVAHTDGTCPECMAETREALHDIGRMCGALPDEVEHRGVEGEAMMLLAPAADPEAWGHMEASVLSGRVPPEYLEENAGELHPEFILRSWQMVWRDALEHDEVPDSLLSTAVDYLNTQMTYMGGYEHVDFVDFSRDLRRCRNHLEAVLHDGEQVEVGAPCMACGSGLRRCWKGRELPWNTAEHPARAIGDGWACPRCKRWHTDTQYRLAVKNLHREEAEWLTDQDMQIRTGVKAGTVRSWAREGSEFPVRKRRDQQRTVYAVADVLSVAKDKGLVA
jgi:hypothetical protein